MYCAQDNKKKKKERRTTMKKKETNKMIEFIRTGHTTIIV